MKILLALVLAGTLWASAAEQFPIIPQPVSVEPASGAFAFSAATGIRYHSLLANEASILADELGKITGSQPKLVTKKQRIHLPSEILIDIDPSADLPASAYRLQISPRTVRIIGKDAAGAFYGTRTLLQLLPAGKMTEVSAALPAVKIIDYPRFGWRGMMLDCGRHFYPVSDIKRFIDALAFHKLNVFHWHLTEDQGWRIEIKKYPKLTESGGFRDSTPPYGNRNSDDGVRYGGFYTQEQIKEVVAYAAERHINIVPEIEMPGHAAAAIAAYPQLGNSDISGYAPKVQTRWGVHPYTFAPTEEVFAFIDDVFTEVCALFPSKYIHMGGDEAPKTQWEHSPQVAALRQKETLSSSHEVQSYFVKRRRYVVARRGWRHRLRQGRTRCRDGLKLPSVF